MITMKKIFTIMLGMIALMGFTACGNNNNPGNDNLEKKIVGIWDAKTYEFFGDDQLLLTQEVSEYYEDYYFEFKADGTGSMVEKSKQLGLDETIDITYTIAEVDGKVLLTLTATGVESENASITYQLDNFTKESFTITMDEDEPDPDDPTVYTQVITFVKR